jgi:hypothetical protein
MTPNSAYKIVNVEKGKDYAPKPATGNSFASSDPVIFSLLCVANEGADGDVVIHSVGNYIDGEPAVRIPAQAFKPGVHYPVYLAKLVDDCAGKVRFVGYQYKVCPLTF